MFEQVKEAFNRQSEIFDGLEEQNEILLRLRSVTRSHLMRHLNSGDRILELNAGTGLDALYLAKKGFHVHAVDISEGMLKQLAEKINSSQYRSHVSFELLSFTDLDKLKVKSFNYIFSNFGGLNCIEDLTEVTRHFNKILKPGGLITLVIMPPISPWEISLALKGKFKQAFRRLHKQGTLANIDGVRFNTFYHSLSNLKKALGKDFILIEAQGLASLSPPPYADSFSRNHPHLYKFLNHIDDLLSHTYPFNRFADHYIATFQFKPGSAD